MKYVFGPIPSRRLGRSLGIDPVPLKTCNWNCVYCQLGRTSELTTDRRDYFPPNEIVAEAVAKITSLGPKQVDWLTFAGSGEPTLHASLGWMIAKLKASTNVPIAVITNGSLLYLPEVRDELLSADAVLPTLDAGSERLYQRIDRPSRELTFSRLVEGMRAFRNAFRGQFWIEVVLIKGLNDSTEALSDLAATIERIGPDQVHINCPVRPPAVATVEVPEHDSVERAQEILGRVADVVCPTSIAVDCCGDGDLADTVCAMVRRHPMTDDELLHFLEHVHQDDLLKALTSMAAAGEIQERVRDGQRYWVSAGSQYSAPR